MTAPRERSCAAGRDIRERAAERKFLYHQLDRDEPLTHSRQRSNAESAFRMVKAKFRDHVRSRTDVVIRNEVLCKFLCHNICVVH
jgi:hypothetical protein